MADAFDPRAFVGGDLGPQISTPQAAPAAAPAAGGFDPYAFTGASTGGAAPDKYQQAAIAERQRLTAAGVPLPEGYTRRAMAGPLLGWSDEIGAAMMTPFEMARQGTWDPREGYKYAKARETLADTAAAQKTGVLGDVAEIGGGLALMPGQVFARPLAAAIGGAGKGVLPAVARAGAYGAESGALGAIQGAGSAETVEDIPEAAKRGASWGALFGAPFGVAAKVAPRTTAVTPSFEELMQRGKQDYRARDRLPVSYDLERAVQQRAADLAQASRNKYGRDAPLTVETLRRKSDEAARDVAAARALNPNPPNPVAVGPSGAPNPWQAVATPRDIASLRREIYDEGAGKVSFDAAGRRVVNEVPAGTPTDERAAAMAAKALGRVVSRPDPALLAHGVNLRDAVAAGLLDTRGRGNFGAAYRSKAVTDQVEKALNEAGSTGSGLNFENRLRQNINKAAGSGEYDNLNPSERLAVTTDLIRGLKLPNTMREWGNRLGGGGGAGSLLAATVGGGAGYAYGQDPYMAAAGAVGAGVGGRILRTMGNTLAQRKAEAFAEKLRQRSPEYESRVAAAPMGPGPGLPSPLSGARQLLTTSDQGAMRDALARMLMFQTTGERQ